MPADKSGSARGDVARVEAQHDSPQPYRIVLVGHRFAYDVDLIDDSDPPALSDLRLAALDADTPIAKRDVIAAANIVDRLAAIAAKFARHHVLAHDRAVTEDMRAGLAKFGIDTSGITMHSWTAPGPVIVPKPRKRGRGRPPTLSTEFYDRVADAAREAEDDPYCRSIARGVQRRAAHWPECHGKEPPLSTVERWLKQAHKLGRYQGPRTRTANQQPRPRETDR